MNNEHHMSELDTYKKELVEKVVDGFKERGREFGIERYEKWKRRFEKFLNLHLPGESEQLNKKLYRISGANIGGESAADKFWREDGEIISSFIDSIKEEIENGLYEPPEIPNTTIKKKKIREENTVSILQNIFRKFHVIVRALRRRYSSRPTLDVKDEYDVQDLLSSLLFLYFDDVRHEEWTPSYAGKSSRADFVLKREKTVVEVKMTRSGLSDKELGNQLIVDKTD